MKTKTYIVTEVVDYRVEATSARHAERLITEDENRDDKVVQVAARDARLAKLDNDKNITNLTDTQ